MRQGTPGSRRAGQAPQGRCGRTGSASRADQGAAAGAHAPRTRFPRTGSRRRSCARSSRRSPAVPKTVESGQYSWSSSRRGHGERGRGSTASSPSTARIDPDVTYADAWRALEVRPHCVASSQTLEPKPSQAGRRADGCRSRCIGSRATPPQSRDLLTLSGGTAETTDSERQTRCTLIWSNCSTCSTRTRP